MGRQKATDYSGRGKALALSAVVIATVIAALIWGGATVESNVKVKRSPVVRMIKGHTGTYWYLRSVTLRRHRDRLIRAVTWNKKEIRRLRKIKAAPVRDVRYAIRLAATAYGVSERDMHTVASCESGHSSTAQNGQYRGVFQEGPMFERGRFGQAGFSVWDPVANAMTAAYTVASGGWSQWSCKP